jgi:cytochrome c553
MSRIGRSTRREAHGPAVARTRAIPIGALCLVAGLVPALMSGADAASQPPRISHPALVLKDAAGKNVLDSGEPISTRQTCGGCHDYDFISDSFHFQQGKSEMSPSLLAAHGIARFNSSPGMFGKFSILPNRQLTHAGVAEASDYDMSQPEWLTKCGVCHTGGGISEFDLAGRPLLGAGLRASGPLDPSYTIRERGSGRIVAWDWAKSGIAESDCFLCHVPKASRGARREEMAAGNFRWADNATLSETGIVVKRPDGSYAYDRAAFQADGTVKGDALALADPTLENCAQCHGFTARSADTIQPIQHSDIMRGTEKAGWIYNGARICDTKSPNILGRERLQFPWDVHAAKGMVCIDCHFSPNNPGRMIQTDPAKNLTYRPGVTDFAVYLKRPDHNFARGNIPPETVNMTRHNTMRGCGDCHDAERGHAFLPYKTLHFKALACQTCHMPAVHFWAYRSDEWGFLMDTGTSRITFRGIDGDIVNPTAKVKGFDPAYITTPGKDGRPEIRPTNVITGLYWFDNGKGRPVFTWQVQQAFFTGWDADNGWTYRPEIVKAFGDADGIIDFEQARYDSPAKIALVRGLLQKYTRIGDPELRIEIVPWAMSHSIVGKDQAIRTCTACHGRNSILHRPVDLDDFLPKGVPVYFQGRRSEAVSWRGTVPAFDNRALLASFYIIGNSRVGWVEWLGWLAVAGALLFALIHGVIRIFGGGR